MMGQAQEFGADRIGMTMVCAAGIAPAHALTLFDKRTERSAQSCRSAGTKARFDRLDAGRKSGLSQLKGTDERNPHFSY
jgi:hypothetical protein